MSRDRIFGNLLLLFSGSVMLDSFVTPWTHGSSVHGIRQARGLEWVIVPSCRGSSQPMDWTCFSWVSKRPALHWQAGSSPLKHWTIDAFEMWCWKTLESPLDCKEIQPVHPKGNQSWIFMGRPDTEAETLILWPAEAKNWLIWKDPDAGKYRSQEEKETKEDEMVRWHHRLNGHEFEHALRFGDRQGSLACCSPWGRKELDTTERLNWTESHQRSPISSLGWH